MSKYPNGKYERHPLSVAGPFYVEEDQCIDCMGPPAIAKELFGFFLEPPGLRGCDHCYVKRQPATSNEISRMVKAIIASCCSGLRYCGDDPAILARIKKAGFASRCDELCDEDSRVPALSAASSGPA